LLGFPPGDPEVWHRDPAILRSGPRRDAIVHAAGANADHGLRRTNADKRRAVETLLRDGEWSQWSDREIARRCQVSAPLVGNIRRELSVNGLQIETTRKVERGGKTYEMETSKIADKSTSRAKPKPAPAPEPEPELQSPETPADVVQAGYVIEQHESGEYCWAFHNPSGPGANFGTLHDTPESAIAEARDYIERGIAFYRYAEPEPVVEVQPEPDPEPLEPPKRGTPEYAAYRARACRAAIVEARSWLATLDQIAELTGLYGQVLRDQRATREWIEVLERHAE
jgi:transposase-like protein